MFKALTNKLKINSSPENSDFKWKSIDDSFHAATKFFEAGSYQDALKNYMQFIANSDISNRYFLNANYHCGVSFLKLDKPFEALKYLSTVIQFSDPQLYILDDVYENQGFALLLMGESHFKAALESFNQSFSFACYNRFKSAELSFFYRGILQFLNQDYENADKDINKSLELDTLRVNEAAVTFCEKIMNKNSPLHKDAKRIIAYLEKMGITTNHTQILSSDDSTRTRFLETKEIYIAWFSYFGKNKELTVKLINPEEKPEIDRAGVNGP